MNKKTLVFGVSLKSNRYSNLVVQKLVNQNIETVAFGLKSGKIDKVEIDDKLLPYEDLHTVTLYISPKHQPQYYNYIVALNPKRVIFNPGTENPEFYRILKEHKIVFEAACSLVLLSTNQY